MQDLCRSYVHFDYAPPALAAEVGRALNGNIPTGQAGRRVLPCHTYVELQRKDVDVVDPDAACFAVRVTIACAHVVTATDGGIAVGA